MKANNNNRKYYLRTRTGEKPTKLQDLVDHAISNISIPVSGMSDEIWEKLQSSVISRVKHDLDNLFLDFTTCDK